MPHVVTCVLEHNKKILVLKRSKKVRTYQGLWGGVAGYVEPKEDPYDTALKEIAEEVGLSGNDVSLIRRGDPLSFTDYDNNKRYDWVVHPFLFHVADIDRIRLDWEHEELRWIDPKEVSTLSLVPRFDDVVKSLL